MSRKPAVLKSGISRDRFPIGEHRETVLREICPTARERFPFYFKLPYDQMDASGANIAMLKWRVYVRRRCIADKEFRAAIWEACRRDFCFFAATFLWTFESRGTPRRLPFDPYTDQVSIASWVLEIAGYRDGAVNKTRGIGLSVIVLAIIYWQWLFQPGTKVAVLTEDESRLDSIDFNSTIGKLQYFHDNMPAWAKLSRSGRPILFRTAENHIFQNVANGSLVQGFVATGTKLRQLRFTWIFADEFAFYKTKDQEEWLTSAAGTCNSMLLVSTWNSFEDVFHRLMYESDTSLLKMSAFWWNNYLRWQGCYKIRAGLPVLVDQEYRHEPDYQFGEPDCLDQGMLRSPWVDSELARPTADRNRTLRDLYGMDVCERTNAYFARNIRTAVATSLTDPTMEGEYAYRHNQVLILPTKKSDVRLWHDVPTNNRGPYTCYADLSGGSGLAYSVACWLDRGGHQVCEYGTNTTDITNFSAAVARISRWLAGQEGDGWVTIDFDNIGPLSKSFSAELKRLGYANIWESTLSDPKSRRAKLKTGEIPTYYGTTNRDKGRNYSELARAVLAMECHIYSDRVADDMARCGRDHEKDGNPKFAKAAHGGKGHGDFLDAAAGAWWRMREIVDLEGLDSPVEEKEDFHLLKWKGDPWKKKGSRWSEIYASR